MRSLWTDQEIKRGQTFIVIRKHEAAGDWKKTWYSVDSECYGCWHNCCGAHPFTDKDMIDKIILHTKQKIRNCEDHHKHGKMKIKVFDFRKKQLTLTP